MNLNLIGIGKRFNYEWVFRQLSFEFSSGNSYAILGPNGSGKSTLLQIIAGYLSYSEGHVNYIYNNCVIDAENIYRYCAFSAPHIELIEEFTLIEFLEFIRHFKIFTLVSKQIIEIIGLKNATNKQLKYFSSGMKQRVKLAQVIFTEAPIVLLDEPCSNLDATGIDLYYKMLSENCKDRLIIISSNEKKEYRFCTHLLHLNKFNQNNSNLH